MDIYDASLNYS